MAGWPGGMTADEREKTLEVMKNRASVSGDTSGFCRNTGIER